MRRRHVKWLLFVLSIAAPAALLPAAGQSRPPESDGSAYTWTGAATLTVDVKPWGGGYVRSDPYLIDCPMACIRSFDSGREVKLTATMTPGHTFKAWEGACAGQGNPCTIKVTGAMDVTAVLEGQYVPPTPPVAVSPSLNVTTSGLTATLTGTGYNPNSAVSLDFEWSTPPGGWFLPISNAATSDASGSWTYTYTENCDFDGLYTGPTVFTVTAADAGGGSASDGGDITCPAP